MLKPSRSYASTGRAAAKTKLSRLKQKMFDDGKDFEDAGGGLEDDSNKKQTKK